MLLLLYSSEKLVEPVRTMLGLQSRFGNKLLENLSDSFQDGTSVRGEKAINWVLRFFVPQRDFSG